MSEENLNCPFCGAPPAPVAGGYTSGNAILLTRSCGSNINRNYPEYTTRSSLCFEREARQKAEAERDEARKDLIKNLQTTGGMPWREWRAECVKETLRADENLARAHKAEAEVEKLRGIIAQLIHYPECWDTACYQTMDDAIYGIDNLRDCFDCQCDECEFRNNDNQ